MIRRLRSALRGSLGMVERTLHRSLGAHWKGFTLGLVVIGAGAPTATYLRPIIMPEQPTVMAAAAMAPGDTVVVYGPRQFNGTTGSGSTYIERFTIALTPGRKYELKLVNGTAGGSTNRVTSAVTKLNGFQVIGTTDLTSSIASVTKVVAVRQIDTLRITVVGPAGSFVTATLSSQATSEFLVNGPANYGIPSGTSKTYTFSFTKAATAGPPYRLYLTNGDSAGGLRVTNASVALNGATVVTTTEFTNAIGSLTKTVTLIATNNVTVTLKGNASKFVTLWFTASDTAAPVVTITAPRADSVLRTSPITVTGTISDASPTSVTVNGVQATVTNNTSYSASVPLSTQGNNLLTVIATDAGGRTRQVTRNVIFDNQAPALTVTAPTDNSATRNATIAVTGSFTDATAVTVRTNGTTLTVTGSTFNGTVPLAMGANVLTTTATDAGGNATSVVRNVARDTIAPVLTVSAPSEGATIGSDSVTVSGSVTDGTAVTVQTNGVSLLVTGTTFSGKVALVAGANTLTTTATDAAGNATSVVRHVSRDNSPPVLTVSAPTEGTVTKLDTITVSGTATDETTVTVATNGTPLPVTGTTFTGKVALAVGANLLTTTATDAGGGATSVVRNVVRDTTPPQMGLYAPPAPHSVTSEDSVLVRGTIEDETTVTVESRGVNLPVISGAFEGKVPLFDGENTILIVATDAAGNTSVTEAHVLKQAAVPPDPETLATPIDPSVATTIGNSTSFLYSGSNPIQTGVAAGTITPTRAAVVRGKVLNEFGDALPAVRITVKDHPEYGQTLSRADGRFDLAANGGGKLVIDYSKGGYLAAQREVDLPWQDYVEVDSVAMLGLDPTATTINFTQPIEVARGSSVTDTSGTRRNTLLFAQGTEVTVTLPNGSSQTISGPINVRSTEYTVGPLGPAAMPAVLPPSSAYTYAVELSVDTAMALGSTSVEFSKPVVSYVENFMNLRVGHAVPVGSYDREKATWIPDSDGRIIKILSVTGGLAVLAVDTTGQPASSAQLTSLGITDAERATLATLYPANQTLWRMRHTHFSPKDYNLIFWLLNEAKHPGGLLSKLMEPTDDPSCDRGSIIYCENQALGEVLPVPGTPFSLHYRSDRVPGYTAESSIELQLGEATLPTNANLESLELSVSIAGQHFERSFPPTPNLKFTYGWNGLDAYGRAVQGSQRINVERCYKYKPVAITRVGSDLVTNSFGSSIAFPGGTAVDARPYGSSSLCNSWQGRLGAWYVPAQGFGGWSLSAAHSYDAGARTLYLGTGERRQADAIGNILITAAGVGDSGFAGDGGPATAARLYSPMRVLAAPDGSLYISNVGRPRISRVTPDGIITTVAGTGSLCVPASNPTCGEGQPATSAPLRFPIGMALGPDGSLYIADQNNSRVRRVTPAGIMTTVAGTGTDGYNGDGIPATTAKLNQPRDVAVGPDGSLYIADMVNQRIRKVSPDGIISTVAGNGTNGFFGGENGFATNTSVPFPVAVALRADGVLYISASSHNRIRTVDQTGIIRTVVGGALPGYSGDGGPATQARIRGAEGMSFGPDGSLYFADLDNYRIRKVDNAGIIYTVAGTGRLACSPRVVNTNCDANNGDGGPATQASLHGSRGVAIGPDGGLYIADTDGDRIRKISPALPGIPATDMLIASESGAEVYRFDIAGRHLQTLDPKTGTALLSFGRDPAGRITTVTDADANVTTIERQADGKPTGILAPFGQHTVLTTDANGYLASVANPAGEVVRLFSRTNGLLDSLVDPKGNPHRFTYSSLGLLRKDENAAGGFKTLTVAQGTSIDTIDVTTAMGRNTRYQVQRMPNKDTRRTITDLAGLATTIMDGGDGSKSVAAPDSTVTAIFVAGDSRFGMQAPNLKSFTVQTPGGLIKNITAARRATLSNPADPLSLVTQLDSLRINGKVFTSSYEAAARRTTRTTSEGRQTITRTDAQGRVVSERKVGLDSVTYQYNGQGHLSQARSGGRVWTYNYDARGRLLSALDPLGRRDSLFYDSADRLTRHVLPGGREVAFAYDSTGNVTAVTPPGRPAHGFGYTPVDLTSGYTPPNVGLNTPATTYQYNGDQQLTRITRPDSVAIVFGYDPAGRPSTVTFDRGQLVYGYSATTGNLTSITAPGSNTLSYSYDGALPKTVTWGGAVQGSLGVGYNTDFRVTSMDVNGANSLTFGYDRDGLLTTAGALGIKRYAQHGLPERDSVGTVKTAWSYTPRAALLGYQATSGGSTLFQTAYVRDSLDRITQLTETVQGTTGVLAFSYDSAGHLKEVQRDGAVTATYEYDVNGNRLHLTTPSGTVTGTYDAQDRLSTYGSTSFSYGSNGELKTRTDGSGTTSYTYDALGNLTAVTLPDATQITYLIDGQNRRVGTRINGTLTQGFLYQGQLSPVAELDGNQQVVSRFVYGTRANVPDYMIKGGVTYRLVSDHLGSVRLVVNTADGSVAQRIDYDEFGRVIQNTAPAFQPFGFAGGLYDEHTKLTRFGARDYDAEAGRWTAKDPIGFRGRDGNLYAYALNDPVNRIDRDGKFAPLVAIGIGVAVIEIVRAARAFPDVLDWHRQGNDEIADDKAKHAWVSEQIANKYGGDIAALYGIGKELVDLANPFGGDYEWADLEADFRGIMRACEFRLRMLL
jgi:RHS repeat-associated protein